MKARNIVGTSILLIIIVIFAAIGFSYEMSNTTASFETLQPNGTTVGNALVVYDSRTNGDTKNRASIIASILPNYGYKVNLVNIKSVAAVNTSEYDVIIVGGPVYRGNVSDIVKAYLEALRPAEGTRVGVFAISNMYTDDELIKKQVESISKNSTFQIKAVMIAFSGEEGDLREAEFVDNLLNRK